MREIPAPVQPDATPSPPYRGPAWLAFGFRPFFLATGLAAPVILLLFLGALWGWLVIPTAFTPIGWHAHEMLFGVVGAAVGGFLLTGVANWTGATPVRGGTLAALAGLWLAGRLAIGASALIGPWLAALIDIAFLPAVVATVAPAVIAGRHWRSLPIFALVAALVIGNGLFHAEAIGLIDLGGAGTRLPIAVIILLIALIGGRIIPTFTGNWLDKHGLAPKPPVFDRVDRVVVLVTAAALLAWVGSPGTGVTAVLAALAAVLNAGRLARWRGAATVREPLLLILHLAYAWLPLALALLSAASWPGSPLPELAAIHAFSAGAMATMILAVMTRATLGHTGRALHAGPFTVAVYALIIAAAAARIGATVLPGSYEPLIAAAALFWTAGFAGFCLRYGPMLLAPRIDGKPG